MTLPVGRALRRWINFLLHSGLSYNEIGGVNRSIKRNGLKVIRKLATGIRDVGLRRRRIVARRMQKVARRITRIHQ